MKTELLKYLAGLCQATSAALLAGAVIMPDIRTQALWGAAAMAALGIGFVVIRENGEQS